MRLANRQHPLHLQVTRTNNGKFLVSSNSQQDGSQLLLQQQQQQQSPPPPTGCEETSTVVSPSPVVFPSCEPVQNSHQGPTIIGDRFLLLGPAECSALYRCVDTHTGQQLVAKVREHS